VSLSLVAHLLLAWPVDMVHDVEPGKEKFVRVAAVEWVDVEDPAVATAEIMESGEVLLSGHKAGRTLVLLYAEGRFAVWRLRVGGKPVPGDLEGANKACPTLEKKAELVVTVSDERCAKALRGLFETDAVVARELDLTFEGKVLQAQLKSLQEGLPRSVASKYVGAGLVLEGHATAAEHRKILWEVFRRSIGRVALEDRIEVKK
jgi:hypothetical protein